MGTGDRFTGSRDGRRRRRLLLLAAAVALTTAVLLALRPDAGPPPAGTGAPQAAAGPAEGTPSAPDVLGTATRGSLAGDAAFLEGVLRRPWTVPESTVGPGIPDAPPETRRVVFAGDVPGGRWALVVGANSLAPGVPPDPPDRDLAVVWFGGPPGAPPEQMALRTVPHHAPADLPVAFADPGLGVLVVVAAPGDDVEVSARPDIAGDGSATRRFDPVAAPDGVAVAVLPPNDLPTTATVYRVSRGGDPVVQTRPELDPAAPAARPPIRYPRGAPSPAGERVAERIATHVLARLGLPGAAVDVTAQWVGDVSGPGPETGPAAVVTVTVPSGAVVVSAAWDLPSADGSPVRSECALTIRPAGPPADRRVHAVACDLFDGTAAGPRRSSLIVVGPPTVATVRAHGAGGDFLVEHPAADGVLVAPFPRGTATVEAITAGGVSLGRVPLLGRAADFGS
ncbi:hypothetical protein [Geodermatophilus sp. CPCC 206100]|uniref:hypothetical protein n=1 Tax=Geodermatophilus sp. CPCC 206100 TaxID=3020054 RepID=UPI003B00E045